MKDILVSTVVAALGIGLLGMVVIDNSAMPDVHVSYSSDQCVKVINYDELNYSCDNLPTRYNHVWVK